MKAFGQDRAEFQLQSIDHLDEEDNQTIFKMIETFLTKKKFKDFFNKNVAAL